MVATKFFNPMGSGPNDSGMSRVHIMNAVEDSLRRLQMDFHRYLKAILRTG